MSGDETVPIITVISDCVPILQNGNTSEQEMYMGSMPSPEALCSFHHEEEIKKTLSV